MTESEAKTRATAALVTGVVLNIACAVIGYEVAPSGYKPGGAVIGFALGFFTVGYVTSPLFNLPEVTSVLNNRQV